jgi:hypothetical protein
MAGFHVGHEAMSANTVHTWRSLAAISTWAWARTGADERCSSTHGI